METTDKVVRLRLIELLVLHETPELDRLRTTYSTSLNDCLYVFAVKYGRFPEIQLYRGYDDDLCCHFLCRKGEEGDSSKPAIVELPDGTIRLFKRRENATPAILRINHSRQELREVVENSLAKAIIQEGERADKERIANRKREYHKRMASLSLHSGCRSSNRVYNRNLQFIGK